MEDSGPVLLSESIREPLGSLRVFDIQKCIIQFAVGDFMMIQFSGQPFMPIEIDLNGERKPCGDPNMHEPKLPIYDVKIETQTFTSHTDKARPSFSIGQFEALTCLHSRKDTYESMGDVILLGDLPGFFLLSNPAVEVDEGSPAFLSHAFGVCLNLFRVFGDKTLEIFEKKALGGDKAVHAFRPADGQVSLKYQAIKTGYRSRNFLCMLTDKFFHGVLPYVVVGEPSH